MHLLEYSYQQERGERDILPLDLRLLPDTTRIQQREI